MPQHRAPDGADRPAGSAPKVVRVVRPPVEPDESTGLEQRGKDEVDYGWGDDATPSGASDPAAELRRRHAAERPPHHDSDWG